MWFGESQPAKAHLSAAAERVQSGGLECLYSGRGPGATSKHTHWTRVESILYNLMVSAQDPAVGQDQPVLPTSKAAIDEPDLATATATSPVAAPPRRESPF